MTTGNRTQVANSMIHSDIWLDDASHTVRLEFGSIEDGNRNGNRVKRSEEHTSELQSLMRTSYAVFCLKKTTQKLYHHRCFRPHLYTPNYTASPGTPKHR